MCIVSLEAYFHYIILYIYSDYLALPWQIAAVFGGTLQILLFTGIVHVLFPTDLVVRYFPAIL